MTLFRVREFKVLVAIVVALALAATRAPAASPLIERLDAGQHQTIVVYGTSLTAGGAWVSQLSSSLNAAYPGQITWINSGLSGKASNSGVANLSANVLSKNPDAVFIEFGMNDAFTAYPVSDVDYDITLAESKVNLNSIIDAVRTQNPAAEIVLQTMNPAWDAPNGNQSGTKRPQLAQYYQGYRDVAAERGLTLVDNFAVWQKVQANSPAAFQSYVSDGTHPNAAAYQQLVTPAIRFALGAPNGLALVIDPSSGRGVLENQSRAAIELISYTIASSSGGLRTTWNSLADRGNADWLEANPTSQNLSELNMLGVLHLAPGAATMLGEVWDPSKPLDVDLRYQTPSGASVAGSVVYSAAAAAMALPGDFNDDGAVDGADFLDWQRGVGSTVPAFTSGDATGDGRVDGNDLVMWINGFGEAARAGGGGVAGTQAVPEPGTSMLGTLASMAVLWNRSSRAAIAAARELIAVRP